MLTRCNRYGTSNKTLSLEENLRVPLELCACMFCRIVKVPFTDHRTSPRFQSPGRFGMGDFYPEVQTIYWGVICCMEKFVVATWFLQQ